VQKRKEKLGQARTQTFNHNLFIANRKCIKSYNTDRETDRQLVRTTTWHCQLSISRLVDSKSSLMPTHYIPSVTGHITLYHTNIITRLLSQNCYWLLR